MLANPPDRAGAAEDEVDIKTAAACKFNPRNATSAACGNRRTRGGGSSSPARSVEQVGRQPVQGGLIDGLEAERLVEAQGRLIGRDRLDVDGAYGLFAGRAEDLGDEETAVPLATMRRGHLD